jgi:hypothetical protein
VELDALILADAASLPGDGKFYIHGGGLTRYDIPALPAPIPIAVLVRLRVENGDLEKEHRINLVLMGPLEIPNVEPIEILATPPEERPDLAEGQEQFLELPLTIPGIALRAGLYQLELRVNGRLAKRVPLPVVVSGEPGPEPVILELSQEGEPSSAVKRRKAKSSKSKRPSSPPKGKPKRQR